MHEEAVNIVEKNWKTQLFKSKSLKKTGLFFVSIIYIKVKYAWGNFRVNVSVLKPFY